MTKSLSYQEKREELNVGFPRALLIMKKYILNRMEIFKEKVPAIINLCLKSRKKNVGIASTHHSIITDFKNILSLGSQRDYEILPRIGVHILELES